MAMRVAWNGLSVMKIFFFFSSMLLTALKGEFPHGPPPRSIKETERDHGRPLQLDLKSSGEDQKNLSLLLTLKHAGEGIDVLLGNQDSKMEYYGTAKRGKDNEARYLVAVVDRKKVVSCLAALAFLPLTSLCLFSARLEFFQSRADSKLHLFRA